ncbi:MAG: DNA-3-methyladenine glycosylase family protein [bacterium]
MLAKSDIKRNIASGITVKLPFNPPFDWPAMIGFLARRAIPGVEAVQSDSYFRSFVLNGVHGVVQVRPDANANHLLVIVHAGGATPLKIIEARLRCLFDLDADMTVIDAHLSKDPLLAYRVKQRPGLRVPGAWDVFELAVRAVLGQQISVAAATTLSGRLVAALGKPLNIDVPKIIKETGISMIFPLPEVVMTADLTQIGLTRARAKALKTLGSAMNSDERLLQPYGTLDKTITKLCELPGIGPWTAQYIAMRAFREQDAFPSSDLGLLRALGQNQELPTPKELIAAAQVWQPWRAYAAMRLWIQPEMPLSGSE